MFRAIREQVDTIFREDPAAKSVLEIFFCYPGFHAILLHRLAHKLYRWKVPFFPRCISQIGRFLTGIEIHPGAQIGPGFFIDHGMGTVIGETAIVGEDVLLYHNVTLGGSSLKRVKRHPTLGNHVVVSAGAKILGAIEIGDYVKVGPNAVVRQSVPPDSVVVGIPGRVVRERGVPVHESVLLDHGAGVDPEGEIIRSLLRKVHELEQRLEYVEGPIHPPVERTELPEMSESGSGPS